MSWTATYVDTFFLFVLQGSGVLKEHHCTFVYATKASQYGVPGKRHVALPETDAVVFFAAEQLQNSEQYKHMKEPMQWLT